MSKNIKMLLQYEGTRYDGWQRQGNTDNTIQRKLEQILERMTGKEVEVHGSGRTDAGVHAEGQVAHAHLTTQLSAEEIREYMNQYLPEDIVVLRAEEVERRFHSRLNAVEKIYTYRLDMAKRAPVFERRYRYAVGESLDVESMKQGAGILCGTHDFKGFCTGKTGNKSTIRTIYEIAILTEGTKIDLQFRGNGFLYHMVRILTGTLIEIGQGKKTADSIIKILDSKDRQLAGFTAPAKGLCLTKVIYPACSD